MALKFSDLFRLADEMVSGICKRVAVQLIARVAIGTGAYGPGLHSMEALLGS